MRNENLVFVVFAKPFSLSSLACLLSTDRMLARALSMQNEISPVPKLPVTAEIVLQFLLTHLALLFGLFSAWL